MTKTSRLLPGLATLLLLTTACSGRSTASGAPAGAPTTASSTVLLLGDSIAAGEALPLTAAFAASGVRLRSLASDGGGNVVGPFADKNWATLPARIADAEPAVVVYQITTYDWGSRQEQQVAYRRLLTTATDAGARLVFVTAPPIRPDDFYRPHLADLERAPDVAREIVTGSSGRAALFDAGAVWGDSYERTRNGALDRSTDGIHTCPQGAARFAVWLLDELAGMIEDLTPADPEEWAGSGWATDKRFVGC